MSSEDNCNEEKDFVEFRRKVRAAEVLSAAMERLLRSVNFSGGSAWWCRTGGF
jgi:hypothetical protein